MEAEPSLEDFTTNLTGLMTKSVESRPNKPIIPNKFWVNRNDRLRSLGKSLKYVARKKKRRPADRSLTAEYNNLAKDYRDQLKKRKHSDIGDCIPQNGLLTQLKRVLVVS